MGDPSSEQFSRIVSSIMDLVTIPDLVEALDQLIVRQNLYVSHNTDIIDLSIFSPPLVT